MAYLRADYGDHASPIAEIKCGYDPHSRTQRKWQAQQFRHYLYGHVADSKSVPLFSSFLFTPMRSGYGRYFDPLFLGFSTPTCESDWLEWLLSLFAPQSHFHQLAAALDIGDMRKLDVWITLPYPQQQQDQFGRIDGESLDFRDQQDRVTAIRWWIHLFVTRWQHAPFHKQLRLRGFRWPREVMIADDRALINQIAQTLQAYGLRWMWLTHYGAAHVADWKSLGFDITLIDSNYRGNTETPATWIDYTAYTAQSYQCGMQFIFGVGLLFDRNHFYEYAARGFYFRRNYLRAAFQLFRWHGFDLITMKRRQHNVYQDFVLLLHGVRKRNIHAFVASAEHKLYKS